jgi:hypothetical protein
MPASPTQSPKAQGAPPAVRLGLLTPGKVVTVQQFNRRTDGGPGNNRVDRLAQRPFLANL